MFVPFLIVFLLLNGEFVLQCRFPLMSWVGL